MVVNFVRNQPISGKLEINHEFIYPRLPKIKGYIEEFNRIFKQEFLHKHELDIQEEKFSEKLTKYLIWYNTKIPQSIFENKAAISIHTEVYLIF